MVVGTNTIHVRRLVNKCMVDGIDVTKTLGFRVGIHKGKPSLDVTAVPARDDEAGQIRWMGPGPLILSPDGGSHMTCKVKMNKPVE